MLKFRLCPNCGSKINSREDFFCYECGETLEPVSPLPRTVSAPEKPAPGKRMTAVPLFFLLLLSLGLGFFLFLRNPSFPPLRAQGVLLSGFSFPVAESDWEKPFLGELVPERVDFYLFGLKPAPFFSRIFSGDAKARVETLLGLSLREAESFLGEEFAFFGQEGRLAFLAEVKARDAVGRKIEELKESFAQKDYFRPYLIGRYLLISNDDKLPEQVLLAMEKKRIHLALTAAFDESWRSTPHRGQYFLYSPRKENLVRALSLIFGKEIGEEAAEKLKGSSWAIRPAEGGTLLEAGKNGR